MSCHLHQKHQQSMAQKCVVFGGTRSCFHPPNPFAAASCSWSTGECKPTLLHIFARFAEILTGCVYHCSIGECKPPLFYTRNSITWDIVYNGRKPKLKKKKKKNYSFLVDRCSEIMVLYENLQCFVLPRHFWGGGNPMARLFGHMLHRKNWGPSQQVKSSFSSFSCLGSACSCQTG